MSNLTIEDITPGHPGRQFYDFWTANQAENGFFLREKFNPTAFSQLLPWAAIVERQERVAGSPTKYDWQRKQRYRYIYRLFGTGLASVWGVDVTGLEVFNTLPSEEARVNTRSLDRTLEENIVRVHLLKTILDKKVCHVINVAFPMSTDGTKLDQILGISAPDDFELARTGRAVGALSSLGWAYSAK